MMKVHREQVRQTYHQNVQSKYNKNDVNCQQNKYDEGAKKSSKKGMEMNDEYKKKATHKYKNNSEKKTRREMMKVHHEQMRQRYHQNVQNDEYNKKATDKYKNNSEKKEEGK